MRRMTLGRKIMIILLIELLVFVFAYCDRATFYDATRMSVYYHSRANCERIDPERDHVTQHSWIKARMIDGLTQCPYCK